MKNRDSDLQQGLSPVARELVESGTTEVSADGSTLELLHAVIDYRAGRKPAEVGKLSARSGPSRSQEQMQDGAIPVSKQEQLSKIIAEIRLSIPELHGVMIAATDGLAIAHDFPDSESEMTAATAATALGLGQRIAERSSLGKLQEAIVHGDDGYLVVCGAGESAVLVLSGRANSNLGLMRIEARSASVEIGQMLR